MPFRQKKVSKAVHKIKRQGLVREHKFWRQKVFLISLRGAEPRSSLPRSRPNEHFLDQTVA